MPHPQTTHLIDIAKRLAERATALHIFDADGNPGAPAVSALQRDARKWLDSADAMLDTIPPGDALEVVTTGYDIVHRIAFRRPASASAINPPILRAFDAMIAGDTRVNIYHLFRAVSDAINRRRDPAFLGRPLRWYTLQLQRWHAQFANGSCIDDIDDYDTLQRVTILLTESLWTFETANEAAYKRRLASRHLHLLTSHPSG